MFAVALSTLPVRAEAYPARSVRIIVPNEPGGIYDLVARLMATELSKRLPRRRSRSTRCGTVMPAC
jgi:tripartite-type tricarboxylate transporter receptor subunit TctC